VYRSYVALRSYCLRIGLKTASDQGPPITGTSSRDCRPACARNSPYDGRPGPRSVRSCPAPTTARRSCVHGKGGSRGPTCGPWRRCFAQAASCAHDAQSRAKRRLEWANERFGYSALRGMSSQPSSLGAPPAGAAIVVQGDLRRGGRAPPSIAGPGNLATASKATSRTAYRDCATHSRPNRTENFLPTVLDRIA